MEGALYGRPFPRCFHHVPCGDGNFRLAESVGNNDYEEPLLTAHLVVGVLRVIVDPAINGSFKSSVSALRNAEDP